MHGGCGRRARKKLDLRVDRSGRIVAEALIDGSDHDPKTALALIAEKSRRASEQLDRRDDEASEVAERALA